MTRLSNQDSQDGDETVDYATDEEPDLDMTVDEDCEHMKDEEGSLRHLIWIININSCFYWYVKICVNYENAVPRYS